MNLVAFHRPGRGSWVLIPEVWRLLSGWRLRPPSRPPRTRQWHRGRFLQAYQDPDRGAGERERERERERETGRDGEEGKG